MSPVLVDTGALYAAADADDAWHERVAAYFRGSRDEMVVPITVLPEVCYLLDEHLGPEAAIAFLRALDQGEARVEHLAPEDISRSIAVMDRYASLRLGFVDASLVAVAERLKIREVLTTDRRHFSAVRPRHCPAFDLRP
jgi:predicted nucleic acid-binding protein